MTNEELKTRSCRMQIRHVAGVALLVCCPVLINAANGSNSRDICPEYGNVDRANPHSDISINESDATVFRPGMFGLVQDPAGFWYDSECLVPSNPGLCFNFDQLDNCYNCASVADFGTDYDIDGGLMIVGSPEARYKDPNGIGGSFSWISAVSIVALDSGSNQTLKGFQPGASMSGGQLSGSYNVTHENCNVSAIDTGGSDPERQAGELESVFAGFYNMVNAHFTSTDPVYIKRLGHSVALEQVNESMTIAAFGFQVSKPSMMGQLETFASAVALVPIRTCDDGTPRFDTQQMQILEIPKDPESGLDPTFSFGLSIALEQGNLIISAPEAGTQQIRAGSNPDTVGPNTPRRGRVFQYAMNPDGGQWEHVRTMRPFNLPGRDVVSGPDDSCSHCDSFSPDCVADFYDCLDTGICGQTNDFPANDYFGCDIDISEDGRMAVIGAPLTIQQFIVEGFRCDGCEDNDSRGWRAGGGAVYVVDLTRPDLDPYLMFNPDSVVDAGIESIFDCGCPPSAGEIGYCNQNLDSWKEISRFFAHGDYFGNSVSITKMASGDYRVAGTIPGDHGWVEDACFNGSSPDCPGVSCPDGTGNCQDQPFDTNLDFGYDTVSCHGQTGGLVLFEFDDLKLYDQVYNGKDTVHFDPYTGSPLLTDALVNRWFWSPGRQLFAEQITEGVGDNALMHARIGGTDWGATTSVDPDFVAFYGGSVDLFDEWVVVGGPYGRYPENGSEGNCPDNSLFQPADTGTSRGATVLAGFDSPTRGAFDFQSAYEIRELLTMPKFEDVNYAPVIGFGECVMIEDGVVYASLSNYESFCESEDSCIDTNRHSSGDIHVYRGLIANCEGDFNGDGVVNGGDFGFMLAKWGQCVGCPEDLNGDDQVSGADVGLFLSLWGDCS